MIGWMAWRLHRRGLIGFSVGGFLISLFYGSAFLQAAGSTAASQAAFGRSVSLVAKQFAFIIPVPVHPETLGGYEQYKWLAGAIVMMMIWAALAGVGIGRGDEDRGITEQWIASGVSRTRLLLARSAAFGLVLLVACVACVLGIVAIAPAVHQDPNFVGEMLKAVSMAAGLFTCYTIALLISQLPAERQTATALGVGAPVLLLIVNGIADTIDSASWIGVVSPFHWMEKTSSAAPGGTFDLSGTLGLAVAAAALLGVAIPIFRRRDIGSGLFTWGRNPHARGLAQPHAAPALHRGSLGAARRPRGMGRQHAVAWRLDGFGDEVGGRRALLGPAARRGLPARRTGTRVRGTPGTHLVRHCAASAGRIRRRAGLALGGTGPGGSG
jgi:ABC-2 type transport system permease protein